MSPKAGEKMEKKTAAKPNKVLGGAAVCGESPELVLRTRQGPWLGA